MGTKIDTAGSRKALEPRPAPYFQRVENGVYLGFRKLESGSGTWVIRWRNDSGMQINHGLGSFDTFDAALKSGREWLERARGGVVEDVSLEEACRRYVTDRMKEKGEETAKDAEGRFNRTVFGKKIGELPRVF